MAPEKGGGGHVQKSSVVGDCIRTERRRAGLSQDQLAERLHVTRQTISNWEGGKSLPDIESLKALAEALCVPIERLIYPEGRSPLWPARLRLDAWCRWLGILVLVDEVERSILLADQEESEGLADVAEA